MAGWADSYPTLGDAAGAFDRAFGQPIGLSRFREPGLSHGLHLYTRGDRWLYVFFRGGRAVALLCIYVDAPGDRTELQRDVLRFLPAEPRSPDTAVQYRQCCWLIAADAEASTAAAAGAASREPWKHWPLPSVGEWLPGRWGGADTASS